MADLEQDSRGFFSLPNEILLRVIDLFDTQSIVKLTPICRHLHSLALRVVHNRLQIASSLGGHDLCLLCHHPSAQWSTSKLCCQSLGTGGLEDMLDNTHNDETYVGQVKRAFRLYSRFRPQHFESEIAPVRFRIPGDIPGSRTYQSQDAEISARDPTKPVSQTVTVDAHDLFSQLTTKAYLVKYDGNCGMANIQIINEGHIRVWRDWLSKQCESKMWTDGEPVVVHHEVPPGPTTRGKGRSDSLTGYPVPREDPNILWVNSRDEHVGVKFRVKERKLRSNAPVMYSSDVEVPVSYRVEFDEIVIRTTHLLLKLEEAERESQTSRAIVFGPLRR